MPASQAKGDVDTLANELRILRHVRHPNVVLFYGACLDVESCGLVLVMKWVLGECSDAVVDKLGREVRPH